MGVKDSFVGDRKLGQNEWYDSRSEQFEPNVTDACKSCPATQTHAFDQ
jgi:hypothetical protein